MRRHNSGLHLTLVLMILIGFSYGTRDINPYLNKGHQKILNIILLCELTTVVFGLIIKTELLSQAGAYTRSLLSST
jgi:hypothetical protein